MSLAGPSPAGARVLLVESHSVLAWRRDHHQTLVLVWSAMRHFARQSQTACPFTSPQWTFLDRPAAEEHRAAHPALSV